MLLMVPPNEFLNCPSLPGTTVKHPLMTLSRVSIGVHSPMEGKQGSERDPIFCFTKPHIYFNEQIHMFLICRLPWHCKPSVCVLKEAYFLARTSLCFRESDVKVGTASKHVPLHTDHYCKPLVEEISASALRLLSWFLDSSATFIGEIITANVDRTHILHCHCD